MHVVQFVELSEPQVTAPTRGSSAAHAAHAPMQRGTWLPQGACPVLGHLYLLPAGVAALGRATCEFVCVCYLLMNLNRTYTLATTRKR